MSAIGPKRTSPAAARTCPLVGVKRTWRFALHMSAIDPKRTCARHRLMTASAAPRQLQRCPGVWVLVSPWVLGFAGTTAMHVHVVIGVIVAVLAALEIWLLYQRP